MPKTSAELEEVRWPDDLSTAERLVVAKLCAQPGLSTGQLAERLKSPLSKVAVSKAWLALSERGLLEIQHQPYKRRTLMRLYLRPPVVVDATLPRLRASALAR